MILMPGPVLFIQTRIGKGGKEFRLLKFRTMLVKPKTSEGSFDAGDQSRITALGKILRKTKLDEIPQLINVLRGDMSLVGPRPEVRKWTEVYPEQWTIVHKVLPGITDNASIEFRNEEELLAESSNPEETYKNVILPRKLYIYIKYVNHHSFGGDLMIIIRTIQSVILK
ncbi:UDP-N-acetylgalactosaminyltransferase [Aquipluma nitroreducens]|uniref:UDP-N-acetylgalactosaminyltransferase n=2 Tax=Aquipluma nitroreducens TaxID=2010828 RepID=A0A5K7SBC3_9BACT|nr:UDP-N-acetylgalactosaminyltransferase [Aquipluma nitroreducens]